jgi:hypothetical protein
MIFMVKEQKYLFIAILIPIIMILIIAFSLLIPNKKISPANNFLYAIDVGTESYTCLQNMYSKFYPERNSSKFYKIAPDSCKHVQLFIYDFKNESAKSISFADAKKLHLTENLPSGSQYFYISRSCYTGPDLGLWSMRSNYNDVCLVKDDYKRVLNLNLQDPKRYFNFIFIGWILP